MAACQFILPEAKYLFASLVAVLDYAHVVKSEHCQIGGDNIRDIGWGTRINSCALHW